LTIFQDLRYSVRVLLKSPGFTAVAALSIALGIGANTAVFSLVNAVLFKPLPVDHPEQLAALYTMEPSSSYPDAFSYPDYLDYRDRNEVFSDLVGHYGVQLSLANSGGQPELIWGELVTGNYFTGLGVKAAAGRTFTGEDDQQPGASPVAVLSYSFWQRRFGGDQQVIGKTLKLNGHDYTVTGVACFGFSGTRFLGFIPDIWVPMMMRDQVLGGGDEWMSRRGNHWMNVNGRMKPGVTIAKASSAMSTVASQLEQAYPETNRNVSIKIIPGGTKTQPLPGGDNFIPFVSALLMFVVGLVLLIACANVANLLLARASVRRREIAIRLALGASRWRLIRQLLTESVLISLLGGSAGLLLAMWALDLLGGHPPNLDFPTINPDYDLALDHRVFGFTLALSVVTGVVFGLLPALQASRPDLVTTLKGESQNTTSGSRRLAVRNILVVSQVALSLMLLISAGLFIRSMQNAERMSPGFDTSGLLLASVDLGVQGYKEDRGKAFYKQLVDRVESLPGVERVSLASPLPLDAYSSSVRVLIEGYVPRSEDDKIEVMYTAAAPNYFQTIGTPIVRGREFEERDREEMPGVVIVNETMARLYWPQEDPIGKRLQLRRSSGPYLEVIGIAKDGKYITLGEDPMPYMFLPCRQSYKSRMTILIRSQADPANLAAGLRREVGALDETLPVFGIKTMPQFMERSLWASSNVAGLVGGFGLAALLLAAVGIYGLMSYSVAQRTREIGIRAALGAQPGDVLRLVAKQGMSLALIGIALGLAGALALTRVMSSLLYGVSATDPATFSVITLLLTAVAFLACYIPARRATKVDPMIALRYE
jgi:predicted permease